MSKYQINKENYKAAESYLLAFSPDGFKKYTTKEDVKKSVEELLESFNSHPDSSFVSCGGLMLTCDEDNIVTIYVDPNYRYREVSKWEPVPVKDACSFALV